MCSVWMGRWTLDREKERERGEREREAADGRQQRRDGGLGWALVLGYDVANGN